MAQRTVTEPASVALARSRAVFDVLSLLIPWDLPDERKERIGPAGDGGYILVNRLRPSQPVMSFGVGPSVGFEMALAQRGHQVLLFDHTIESLPETHPNFRWFREGIAGRSAPEQSLFPLAAHLTKLPPGGAAPILKIDVEGAEWETLARTPPELLRRFEQIALELHGLGELETPAFNALARAALGKLAAEFTLCHVHSNNFCALGVVGGFPLHDTFEVTYIRSDLVARAPSATIYPTAIDIPNYHHWPDHLLWYFPFAPGSAAMRFPDAAGRDEPEASRTRVARNHLEGVSDG